MWLTNIEVHFVYRGSYVTSDAVAPTFELNEWIAISYKNRKKEKRHTQNKPRLFNAS